MMNFKVQVYQAAVVLLCLGGMQPQQAQAQQKKQVSTAPVYVDKQGVMRWEKDNKEANFFGVNYTVPFAYGYRSHKALGVELESAIDQDVYHMARLGFDAFRVHVWDTEISDSTGNLLDNEHLRLFDYLIYKLKQRNIKVLVTPIAFWGNGYPEPDEKTQGFSSVYNKQQAVTEEKAFKAQERYLNQFFQHVNPYTKLTYQNDPNIIAAEINNEPKHSGPKARATEYVNRMVAAVRGAGWTKPLFYNISESPTYADAVAKSNIDGVSFQWYPTGLVANHTLKGNYLPNVDTYHIPFDTIPAYANKARMVYEFDAGDVLQSVMYPAMARSFREAGFQWATQFAYDPMATAYANTEYQTHYLNLAYTPGKALSALIASKAFHKLPRLKSYATYPADSVFDAFRVSYKQNLSEMNTAEEFYYSNSTGSRPVNAAKLRHIAGVGTSPVVTYQGQGAYFLDKLENGVWRLEVMPDAIQIRDPFAKASPDKEVTRIQWAQQPMQISLPDMGNDFTLVGLNTGNDLKKGAKEGAFKVTPGAYLLVKKGKKADRWSGDKKIGVLRLNEFVAPKPVNAIPFVTHEPYPEVTPGKPFEIKANIVGIDSAAKVILAINNLSGVYKTVPLNMVEPYTYTATVPAELATPGVINYRIIVEQPEKKFYTFPGRFSGNPWAWDYYHTDAWATNVAGQEGALELFDAGKDRNIYVYPNLWRSNERQLIAAKEPNQLILRLSANELPEEGVMGFQTYIADKLKGRTTEIPGFTKIVLRARSAIPKPIKVRVALISDDATAYVAYVTVGQNLKDIEIPLSSLKPEKHVLLPRPYPGFHPFWFAPDKPEPFKLNQAEKLEVLTGKGINQGEQGASYSLDVESVQLQR
ncbi:cellulase family glycosylhydrolase [Pontibacter sp. MBLB2868]|uniref:cellulase family glycosylhydrolase n=1 Tax=Pontibacter sp. MBLB2868 TaxID=3451555 RepID=UPI003F7518F1